MKTKITIPNTDIEIHPLGLGTVNAGLAWDGKDADRIFDAFLDMGGSLIDTAHVYSDWVKPERARSERVIGDWLERSGKRNRIVLATKGGHPDMTVPNPDTHISRMKKPAGGGADRSDGRISPERENPLLRMLQLDNFQNEGS